MANSVLLADRDRSLLRRYRAFLTGEGFRVTTGGTASECLEGLEGHALDAVVLDPDLPWPRLDHGLSFLSAILGGAIPVILLTLVPEPEVAAVMPFPVSGCYVKPLRPARLAALLRALPVTLVGPVISGEALRGQSLDGLAPPL